MKYRRTSAIDQVSGSGYSAVGSFTVSQENEIVNGTKTIGRAIAAIGFFTTDPSKIAAQIVCLLQTSGANKIRLKWLDEATDTWVQIGPDQTVNDTGGLSKTQSFTFMDAAMPLARVAWMVEGTKEGTQYKIQCVTGALLVVP